MVGKASLVGTIGEESCEVEEDEGSASSICVEVRFRFPRRVVFTADVSTSFFFFVDFFLPLFLTGNSAFFLFLVVRLFVLEIAFPEFAFIILSIPTGVTSFSSGF